MNITLFALNRGIGAGVFFFKIVIFGVILTLLTLVLSSVSHQQSSLFRANEFVGESSQGNDLAVNESQDDSKAIQEQTRTTGADNAHFSAGIIMTSVVVMIVFFGAIYLISFMQRAYDAGQSNWIAFFACLLSVVAIYMFSLYSIEVPQGKRITSSLASTRFLTVLLLFAPTLILGALKPCACET
jgi:hypothetical protein